MAGVTESISSITPTITTPVAQIPTTLAGNNIDNYYKATESEMDLLDSELSGNAYTTRRVKNYIGQHGRYSYLGLNIGENMALSEYDDISNSNSLDRSLGKLQFDLPNWGVEDYITERDKWVKGIRSIGDEPGWFYVKVFFKFNTNYGLFGGTLNSNKAYTYSSNTALRYLLYIVGNENLQFYKQENIPARINALIKFARGLSNINTQYPWMIKGVSGLENVMNNYTEKFSEEKSIEVIFNTETTDMKLTSLLNMYKYACFDDINCKEIIPENLRKFDMKVVLYHVPIKYYQTAIMVSPKKNLSTGIMGSLGAGWAKAEDIINKTFNFLTTKSTYYKYKRMHPDGSTGTDFSNMMSFQMFTFCNCEFDVSSFGKLYEGSEIKNEQAFQLTDTSIKINYDRVYYHHMNEWNQTFMGSDGYWYDPNYIPNGVATKTIPAIISEDEYNAITGANNQSGNLQEKRLQSLKQAYDGRYFYDKNAQQYKALIDYSESMITDGLMSMDMKNYYSFIKGNIYGPNALTDSDYFKNSINVLKTGNIRGNIYGANYGIYKGKPSPYFSSKLKQLKEGTISGNLYDGKGITRKNNNPDGEPISDPYTVDQIKTKKKQIWNYQLTGSSSSSAIGGLLNSLSSISSFWKW